MRRINKKDPSFQLGPKKLALGVQQTQNLETKLNAISRVGLGYKNGCISKIPSRTCCRNRLRDKVLDVGEHNVSN